MAAPPSAPPTAARRVRRRPTSRSCSTPSAPTARRWWPSTSRLTARSPPKFWPLYERYQKEINAIGDRLVAIVEDYTATFRDLSNDKALQLIDDYLAVEAERIKVRRTYLDEFAKILPGRTVARFYQIENKMDAVLRYDLAATIPVVDEKRDAPAK